MSPEVTAVAVDPMLTQIGFGLFVIGGLVYAISHAALAYKNKR